MGPRRQVGRLLSTCFVAAAALVPVLGDTAVACASAHGRLYLAELAGGANAGSAFYAGAEGGQVLVTIRPTPSDCVWQPSSGTYATANGSAQAGSDYTATSGSTGPLCIDVHPPTCGPTEHQVPLALQPDGATEAAVESFTFALTSGTLDLAEPSSAPVHIIDNNGSNRVSLEPSLTGGAVAYEKTEFGTILIPIFWAGSSPGGFVNFSVEPDPASPATPGEDYTVKTASPLSTGPDRVGFIEIDIVGDKLGENPESVIITIQPGAYAVAQPSTTKFTILDNEESQPPTSKLHHPRHKWRYKKSDYRIREVHIFTHDNPGGSGVVAAQLGIRRNMNNGDCQWLTKSGWKRQDCQNREWLPTQYDDVGELWRYRAKQLKSSVGTKIKNYTAFSRAIDAAENVEKDFAEKRNQNTFEIKRTRRL